MLELMNKWRMPVLWLCVILMGGFGVWWMFADLFSGGKRTNRELGTYQIPGGKVESVTDAEFSEQIQPLESITRRDDPAQIGSQILKAQVQDVYQLGFAYFILRDMAYAAGIPVTDAMVIDNANRIVKKYNASAEAVSIDDYKKAPAVQRELRRDMAAIAEFRDLVDQAQPEATWDKLYERFKSQYEEVRTKFVFFDTQDEKLELDPKTPAGRQALEKWFSENQPIRAQKMVPEQLDADVLYVRYHDVSNEEFAAMFAKQWKGPVEEAKLTVTDEKLRERFDTFRHMYETPLKLATDKHQAETRKQTGDSKPADNPTEFELMKDRLRQEYLVSLLSEKVYEAVTRKDNPLTLQAAADKYGFRLATVTKLDSVKIQQHPDFPNINVATALFAALRDKKLVPPAFFQNESTTFACKGSIEDPGSNVAIWHVNAYYASREPTLDDTGVLDFAVEEYTKKKKQDLAKERADEFKRDLDQKVAEAIKAKEAEFDAAMKAEVEKQIKDKGLARERTEDGPKILDIENAAKAKRDADVDAERGNHEARIFEELAKQKNLAIQDTGWVRKTGARNATFNPTERFKGAEKASQFFRKTQRTTAVGNLKKGRVGAVEVETAWYAAAVPLLVDKREPSPNDLYMLGKQQLDQLKSQVVPKAQTTQTWSYENLKRAEWANLNSPEIEKQIKDRAEAEKKKEEQTKAREEKKRKESKGRAEKLANEALRTRPLKSGEDW